MLVQPEVVVCSHIWADDALSSSEHFSESLPPTLKYFSVAEDIFNGWLSDKHRRLTYLFQKQECLAHTANWFPISKWTLRHRFFSEIYSNGFCFQYNVRWNRSQFSRTWCGKVFSFSPHFREPKRYRQNARSRISEKPFWSIWAQQTRLHCLN